MDTVKVKTKKRISRYIFKNDIGEISKKNFINYGVGDKIKFKNKIPVKINGDCQHILNTDLELVR